MKSNEDKDSHRWRKHRALESSGADKQAARKAGDEAEAKESKERGLPVAAGKLWTCCHKVKRDSTLTASLVGPLPVQGEELSELAAFRPREALPQAFLAHFSDCGTGLE